MRSFLLNGALDGGFSVGWSEQRNPTGFNIFYLPLAKNIFTDFINSNVKL